MLGRGAEGLNHAQFVVKSSQVKSLPKLSLLSRNVLQQHEDRSFAASLNISQWHSFMDQSGTLKVRYDDFLKKKHANVLNGLRIGSQFELPRLLLRTYLKISRYRSLQSFRN
jgi:hypothetical protein